MKTLLIILLVSATFLIANAEERRMTLDQRRERVETVIIGKFAEELELSPEEAEKFYPRLRQFRAETDDLQRQLHDTRQKLDALSSEPMKGGSAGSTTTSLRQSDESQSGESSSQRDVKSLISQSNALQTEILAKREILLTDLADFLSPQQVSRCSILMDELPRRLRQFMDERGQQPGESQQRQRIHRRQTR